MAAWTGWEQSVLFRLGVPNTEANVRFLSDWHPFEESKCANNPLNVTTRMTGSTDCVQTKTPTVWVQAYRSEDQGAQATADFFRYPNYVAIVAALKGGNPYTFGVPQAVANAITTWGTPKYAAAYLAAVGAEPKPTPPPGTTPPGAAKASPDMQVGAAWNRLMRTLSVYTPHQLSRTRAASARLRKAVR